MGLKDGCTQDKRRQPVLFTVLTNGRPVVNLVKTKSSKIWSLSGCIRCAIGNPSGKPKINIFNNILDYYF